MLTNMIDHGLDPQAAIDMPRVFASGGAVEIEKAFPASTLEGLFALGHGTSIAGRPFGGGKAVFVDRRRGVLSGGSDPRRDGMALGY